MTRLKRIWQKIKEGKLRQVLSELAWIYGYGKRYRSAVTWYIFLGVLGTGMSLMASVLSKNIVDVVTGGGVLRVYAVGPDWYKCLDWPYFRQN